MTLIHRLAAQTAPTVGLSPDPSQLPGAAVLQNLTNGIGGWAMIAALVGLVIGAVANIPRTINRPTAAARASSSPVPRPC
jgi:hypothetical protein